MRSAAWRFAAVVAGAMVVVLLTTFSPLVLRSINAFRVQRVELVGARHLTVAAAVEASGLDSGSNIFDDPAPWLEALRTHPLVAEARIERRLPRTIVLRVVEAVPIAFARTPELRPIDETGRVLPASTAAPGMDLPVLAVSTKVSAGGRAADAETRRIVAFLGSLMRAEPGLTAWISEIGMHGDAIRLVLRTDNDAEALVPVSPADARLRELHLTLADLATPRGAASRLSRVRRIDVRYHDQVVVALDRGES